MLHVYSSTSGDNVFNVEGTNGSLFSVVDNLSGTLMSVNTIAGLPVFQVNSDYSIVGGRFNQNDFNITAGGDIGIGTAIPSGKLHIYDNNSAGWSDTSFRIQNPASPNNTYFDIAIGTSTGYGDNVWFKRNGVNVAGIYSNNLFYHYQHCMIKTDKQFLAESNANAFIELLDGSNDMKIGYLSDLRFYSSYVEKMVLDINGNLGIGTSTPEQKLHINDGNVKVENVTNPTIEYDNGSAVKAKTYYDTTNETFVLKHNSVSGDEQLVLTSGGNVGVGTNSPNAILHAYGSTPSGTVFNVEGTNGSLFSVVDNLSGVLMSVNNNAGLPVFEVYDDDSIIAGRFAQNDFVITSSGDIGMGTASPSQKLDIRYPSGDGMALLKSTDTNDGLLFGDMAFSVYGNTFQGIKHANMGGLLIIL